MADLGLDAGVAASARVRDQAEVPELVQRAGVDVAVVIIVIEAGAEGGRAFGLLQAPVRSRRRSGRPDQSPIP